MSRPSKAQRTDARIRELEAMVDEAHAERDKAMRLLLALVAREGRVRLTREELEAVGRYDGIDIKPGVLGLEVTVSQAEAH